MKDQDKKIQLSDVERIKEESNFLRGTLVESLKDPVTGSVSPDDVQLIKFHGSYQQYDRELERERKQQKLEPLYSFMIRVRVPGGVATPKQWQDIDAIAGKYANGTIKLTTRQAFQYHGVFKKDLKKTIKEINDTLMDTIAACGDVNRNVMCTTLAKNTEVFDQVIADAKELNDYFTPRTNAYHEIWLDKELVAGGAKEEEPIYGKTYLPRKFKTAFAIPPLNDVDIYANDLGFIAVEKDGVLQGYNVLAGGGMGMTFGNEATYPRLADILGYVEKNKMIEVAEAIITTQRDYGNRSDRKNARLKYTIDKHGLEWFKAEIEKRLGYKLNPAKKIDFERNGDLFGWMKDNKGLWHLGLFVEGGRVKDTESYQLRTALHEVSKIITGEFRLTGNQNLVISNLTDKEKKKIESILKKFKVPYLNGLSGIRKNSIACVALNTCSLAHAEAERYLPSLIDKIEPILEKHKLLDEDITIRMTGCPNGCGRPYLGEIGFVGRSEGLYNMYLGAGFLGQRLNKLHKEMVDENQILEILENLFADYANKKNQNEKFGDFLIRKDYVKQTMFGKDFHA